MIVRVDEGYMVHENIGVVHLILDAMYAETGGFLVCCEGATGMVLCQNPHRYVKHLPMLRCNAEKPYKRSGDPLRIRQH